MGSNEDGDLCYLMGPVGLSGRASTNRAREMRAIGETRRSGDIWFGLVGGFTRICFSLGVRRHGWEWT